jgi:hypothetical protein
LLQNHFHNASLLSAQTLLTSHTKPGLPDGLFSNQKYQIWVNFGVTCNGSSWTILRPFGIFYCHLVYIGAVWFGIFCGHLVYVMVILYIFSCVAMLYQEKSGNPEQDHSRRLL